MFEPRDQIRAMSGYHSPQVDVPIRLNTNESPFAPPEEWLRQLEELFQQLIGTDIPIARQQNCAEQLRSDMVCAQNKFL